MGDDDFFAIDDDDDDVPTAQNESSPTYSPTTADTPAPTENPTDSPTESSSPTSALTNIDGNNDGTNPSIIENEEDNVAAWDVVSGWDVAPQPKFDGDGDAEDDEEDNETPQGNITHDQLHVNNLEFVSQNLHRQSGSEIDGNGDEGNN